ncbi:MAG: HAMP domain-containing histidine kinase [Proteobacteria bacterium]|nr:HAMP domain-containing histidine kinase [Pseudomonadota bacterium]
MPDPPLPSVRFPLRVWLVASYVFVLAVPLAMLVTTTLVMRYLGQQDLMRPTLVTLTLLALAGTTLLSLAISHFLSRSLRALSAVAHGISEGRFAETAMPGANSHVIEVAGLAGDIGALNDRLRQRLAYITEFAGNVSHEFKTPITTLRGTVELLRDDDEMPPEQQARFLENALAELDRMERLVGGLLALARAEEQSEREPLALAELVARVAQRHPDVVVEPGAGRVIGEARQLEAALDNLVENAVHHGAGAPVHVVGWSDEGATGVDVIDAGPGISEANRALVFDRFFTTDREGGGIGLGLSLARAVCRAHGGEIEVESAPGKTRFRVSLPRTS